MLLVFLLSVDNKQATESHAYLASYLLQFHMCNLFSAIPYVPPQILQARPLLSPIIINLPVFISQPREIN